MRYFETLKRKDVGSIGIGAMIVFIAMVLVAGIAASVLIQTSTTLETQAMATGRETTEEVASGLEVFDVLGYADTANSADISKIAIGVRPRAGSDGIDIITSYMELANSTKKAILNYSVTYFDDDNTGYDDVFSKPAFPTVNARFGILVVEDADSSIAVDSPVLNRGDKVYLCVNTTAIFGNLEERIDIWGYVAPEIGAPGIISFRTPASYTDDVMDLQ